MDPRTSPPSSGSSPSRDRGSLHGRRPARHAAGDRRALAVAAHWPAARGGDRRRARAAGHGRRRRCAEHRPRRHHRGGDGAPAGGPAGGGRGDRGGDVRRRPCRRRHRVRSRRRRGASPACSHPAAGCPSTPSRRPSSVGAASPATARPPASTTAASARPCACGRPTSSTPSPPRATRSVPGTAGENVLVAGVDWATLRPGVRLRVGTVLAEVSGWALPCKKNAQWFVDGDFRRIDPDLRPGWSRAVRHRRRERGGASRRRRRHRTLTADAVRPPTEVGGRTNQGTLLLDVGPVDLAVAVHDRPG